MTPGSGAGSSLSRTLPTVLLLDMDDTILDNSGARDDAWRQACMTAADAHPGLDVDALYREVERAREIVWSDPEWHREWRMKVREAWGEIAGRALAALGIDAPELGQLIGDRHFELRDAAIAPLPGAIEALHRLRDLEVRLGLITNGASAGQRAKIERFALGAHFDYIGIEEEVGFGKPHADAYRRALASLEVKPEETWMVGDTLEWDVAGAQAVGIFGIWLDKAGAGLPKDCATRPDRIVRSIGELVPER
jgi:putative hydrolase of the HAD superfamily